ncbi:hypothetical protein BT69DRAFT_1263119 [Atractiella rhizophila]|nr:hypothetical protein BT69DRAFT_1263119 [Atractiella rhizophila]
MDQPTSPPDLLTLAAWYQTHAIPQRFSPGIVVASIIVSFLGCYTSLLLIGRRTGTTGRGNVLLLLLSAGTMASVGIWGMHFLGIHITLVPAKGVLWYIKFHPAFTVLSLFVPLIALAGAFVFLGSQQEFSFFRVLVTGILFGLIISLMHYSASLSASFAVSYQLPHLIGSIVLSCVSSAAALLVFFRLRHHWQDVFHKRALCALGLACSVSGMHYVALAGTSWKVKKGTTSDGFTAGRKSSNTLVIAISVMSFFVCLLAIAIGYSDHLIKKKIEAKAREVLVVSVAFDKQGRVLTHKDGVLPMKVIESRSALEDILYQLDHRQSTFQYLYSLSFDWSLLTPYISKILAHSFGIVSPTPPTTAACPFTGRRKAAPIPDFDKAGTNVNSPRNGLVMGMGMGGMGFVEKFIESAVSLAGELKVEVEDIGVLYDRILTTGTRGEKRLRRNLDEEKVSQTSYGSHTEGGSGEESEAASVIEVHRSDKGVMLFLVRQISGKGNDSPAKYAQNGYRFVEPDILAKLLGQRFWIDEDEMASLLQSLNNYGRRGFRPLVQSEGLYVGLFGVRAASTRQGGVETLVYNFSRLQIPCYRLPDVQKFTQEMREWVTSLTGRTMNEVLAECERSIQSSPFSDLVIFQTSLATAVEAVLVALVDVYPNIGNIARLSTELTDAPASLDDSVKPANIILFEAVLPAGFEDGIRGGDVNEGIKGTPFMFTPYSLFAKGQMMMMRGKSAKDFGKEVMKDLGKKYADGVSRTPGFERHGSTIRISQVVDSPRNSVIAPSRSVTPLAFTPPQPSIGAETKTIVGSPFQDDDIVPIGSVGSHTTVEDTPLSLASSSKSSNATLIGAPISGFDARKWGTVTVPRPFIIRSGSVPPLASPPSPPPTARTSRSFSNYNLGANVPLQTLPSSVSPTSSPPNRPLTLAPGLPPAALGPPIALVPVSPSKIKLKRPGTGHSASISVAEEEEVPVPKALPVAIHARLRCDDWYARCMSSLELSPDGDNLLGVNW